MAVAIDALREREGIHTKNASVHIGRWSTGQEEPSLVLGLGEWASDRSIQGVIWTALPARFNGAEDWPAGVNVVKYLAGLTGNARDNAERYIRYAPRQIDTAYRRTIESALGWTALESRF